MIPYTFRDLPFLQPKAITYDTDASAWFTAVETAGANFGPSASAIANNKNAFNTLVLDLKSNSIWTALSYIHPCIGISTYNVPPLRGTGQTITGFVIGDYSATTGLKGGTGRTWIAGSPSINFNSFAQNDLFVGIYPTIAESSANGSDCLFGNQAGAGFLMGRNASTGARNRSSSNQTVTSVQTIRGLVATSRGTSTTFNSFANGTQTTVSNSSGTPSSQVNSFWANSTNASNSNRTMAFPMIGTNIPTMGTLNTLLATFINSIIWV